MKFHLASAALLAAAIVLPIQQNDAYSFTPRKSFGLDGKLSPSSQVVIPYSQSGKIGSTNNRKRQSVLEMNDDGGNKAAFSLSSLFGNSSSKAKKAAVVTPEQPKTTSSPTTSTVLDSSTHPSVREHINPLNQLRPEMIAKLSTNTHINGSGNDEQKLPVHPNIKSGVLDNGFSYVILPNKSPAGRFEAHLQVFSGSADELEPQQGIAHLTEHVAYMGSRKRERLFGTGSQTNAYTDFHHTVFYAVCPTYTPRSNGNVPMLPMALDALCDVMEARVEKSRLEKERAAVLSEMTMVNTIEYRVECQILGTLHRENRLAKRFPIGKESLIRSWQPEDVKTWHRTHYRPDNVLLYIVGDVEPSEVEKTIKEKFGHLTAAKQAEGIALEELKPDISNLADALVGGKDVVKSRQSWHYPPVKHEWSSGSDKKMIDYFSPRENQESDRYDLHLQDSYALDEKVEFLKTNEISKDKKIRPHIFRYVIKLCIVKKKTQVISHIFAYIFLLGMSFFKHFLFTFLQKDRWKQSQTYHHSVVVLHVVLLLLLFKFALMSGDVMMTQPVHL